PGGVVGHPPWAGGGGPVRVTPPGPRPGEPIPGGEGIGSRRGMGGVLLCPVRHQRAQSPFRDTPKVDPKRNSPSPGRGRTNRQARHPPEVVLTPPTVSAPVAATRRATE